jgi:hypothetical protein
MSRAGGGDQHELLLWDKVTDHTQDVLVTLTHGDVNFALREALVGIDCVKDIANVFDPEQQDVGINALRETPGETDGRIKAVHLNSLLVLEGLKGSWGMHFV